MNTVGIGSVPGAINLEKTYRQLNMNTVGMGSVPEDNLNKPLATSGGSHKREENYSNYATYFMIAVGGIPGTVYNGVNSKKFLCFNILNFLCCVLVITRMALAFAFAWETRQAEETNDLLYKILILLWVVMLTIEMLSVMVSFYGGNYRTYNESYSIALRHVRDIGGEVDYVKERKVMLIVFFGFLFTSISNTIFVGINYGTTDPIYGYSLQNRTSSHSTYMLLYSFGLASFVLISTYWVMFICYFITITIHISFLITGFNESLAEESLTEDFPERILSFRIAHLKLCNLVNSANKVFRMFLAIKSTLSIVVLLLDVYMLTRDNLSFSQYFNYAMWLAIFSISLLMIVAASENVRQKVSPLL